MATGWSTEFDIKCVCVQFQAGGDPKTGVARSAQEAQAQAILQQTTV